MSVTLYTRAMLWIGTSLAVVTGLSTYLSIQERRTVLTRNLNARLIETSSQQAIAVSDALWKLNKEGTEVVLQGLARDPDFLAVRVLDETGRVFASVGGQDVAKTLAEHSEAPIIVREGNTERRIGTLTLYFTRSRLETMQRDFLWEASQLGLLQLLAVLLATGLALRTVIKPLEAITNRMLTVAGGDLTSPIPFKDRPDQLGNIARAVELFGQEMDARHQATHQLELAREHLERRMTEYEHTEAQLRQAQKMEAVGQLTGGVAHDFHNILMVIMANVESLQEDSKLDAEALERTKQINAAVQRATDLTRQLLAFSRKQALRPQHININDLVAATGALLRRALGEQIEIQSVLADDLWNVEIDRAQLESALVNLCINARDAMPGGGRLLIETINTTLDEDYVARNPDVAAGDYVMVVVTDNGGGMPPDVLNQVFEPFFTTKGMGKGSGLGLSMVYGFIKQSKGDIKIYSEVDRGTSIKLYLPRSDRQQEGLVVQQSPLMPGGNERILVVEDEANVRVAVVHQLQSLGYATSEAPDGAAGLAAFDAASQSYDLLLTDVIMPGPMNGRALADEAARRWSKTKIVFMSGYTENALGHHGRLDAGTLLLSKPFRKSDLAQIIRRALDSAEGPEH